VPSWSEKDQRTYVHIRDAAVERGQSEEIAKELAARTVNKKRRLEHRTPNKTTQGTGNPRVGLADRSVLELRNLASELKIEGRSRMKKADLVHAIQHRQSRR
jgi:hypothetical protein